MFGKDHSKPQKHGVGFFSVLRKTSHLFFVFFQQNTSFLLSGLVYAHLVKVHYTWHRTTPPLDITVRHEGLQKLTQHPYEVHWSGLCFVCLDIPDQTLFPIHLACFLGERLVPCCFWKSRQRTILPKFIYVLHIYSLAHSILCDLSHIKRVSDMFAVCLSGELKSIFLLEQRWIYMNNYSFQHAWDKLILEKLQKIPRSAFPHHCHQLFHMLYLPQTGC